MSGPLADAVVVDASVAIKWVLDEPLSPEADALLAGWLQLDVVRLAPALLPAEVANVLYQRVRRGQMEAEDAYNALEVLLTPPLLTIVDGTVAHYRRALELSTTFSLRASYDAVYLALAEARGVQLWTAGERLRNSVAQQLPWVRWLGELTVGSATTQP